MLTRTIFNYKRNEQKSVMGKIRKVNKFLIKNADKLELSLEYFLGNFANSFSICNFVQMSSNFEQSMMELQASLNSPYVCFTIFPKLPQKTKKKTLSKDLNIYCCCKLYVFIFASNRLSFYFVVWCCILNTAQQRNEQFIVNLCFG